MFWCIVLISVLCSVSGFRFTGPDAKCDAKDVLCLTELAKSILDSSVHGNEEIGAFSLDPLHQDVIENHEPDLDFSLKDSVIKGFKDFILKEVKISEENNKPFIQLDITLPNCEMTGNYKFSGKVINLPITGEGKYFFNGTNIHAIIKALKEFYNKDGNKHLKLTQVQTKTELLGAIHFEVENLNEGNKAESEPVMKFMNENPKAVADYFKDFVIKAVIKSLFVNINKILEKVSLDELVIGE